MVSDPDVNVRKPRQRLSPSEKYEIYVAVLTGQVTQREAAERFGVDRSTVVHVCRTAKQGALAALAASVPGRPGQSAEQAALEAARAEIARLRATVAEQAVALHLHQGKARWDSSAGPVPPRVDATVKAGLLDLLEHAQRRGWSARRASSLPPPPGRSAPRWRSQTSGTASPRSSWCRHWPAPTSSTSPPATGWPPDPHSRSTRWRPARW